MGKASGQNLPHTDELDTCPDGIELDLQRFSDA